MNSTPSSPVLIHSNQPSDHPTSLPQASSSDKNNHNTSCAPLPPKLDEINTRSSSPVSISGSEADFSSFTPMTLSSHPDWSEPETVVLQVEDMLFQVSYELLKGSPHFEERRGAGRDHSIVLEDVKVFEMEALLAILSARYASAGFSLSESVLTNPVPTVASSITQSTT
ncbi:hypothetical protein FRB93_008766 [Tulasnella sp. JGI-2019a]|nr:hypothetical protein FRB93_008766 [Tulasnella sp. JGI-2019a]